MTPTSARADALRALVADHAVVEAVADAGDPLPEDVRNWLARLALLEGLPFELLVPDARMLPQDSIRFFFLDENWVDALVDGVLSVVANAETDSQMLRAVRGRTRAIATTAAAARRRAARAARLASSRSRAPDSDSESIMDGPTPAPPWTGFLMRSTAAADWPGLVVRGFGGAPVGPLDLLRLDRPAPGIMVAVFGGAIERVLFSKPSQGLGFGIDGNEVFVRGLGGKVPAGEQPPGNDSVGVPLRQGIGDRKVLDVAKLRSAIADKLGSLYKPDPSPPVGPAAFSLQLLATGELQVFAPGAPPEPQAPPDIVEARRDAVTVAELAAWVAR